MELLVVDNFDSFTYMLVDYLQQAGATCRVVRNNESWSRLTAAPVDAVVLSPGPGVPKQAGRLLDVIAYYYQQIPILGVCLGHQALGEFFGAKLIQAQNPCMAKCRRCGLSRVICCGGPAHYVCRDALSFARLNGLARAPGANCCAGPNELMAMRHRTLPLWGVQFHPEAALTQHGLRLIKNWIDFVLFTNEKTIPTTSLTAQHT